MPNRKSRQSHEIAISDFYGYSSRVDLPPSLGENSPVIRMTIDKFKGHEGMLQLKTLFAASFGVLFAAAFSPAQADFRVCNDTKSLVGVSLGYSLDGNWKTEGWWQVPGETCASILQGELNSRFYYIYAEDADRGGQWRGDIFMCTANKEFEIDGANECFERGFQKTGFFEIDTDNRDSWMVRLTESGQAQSSGQ